MAYLGVGRPDHDLPMVEVEQRSMPAARLRALD
jgi:hypothetical protein